MDFKLKRLANGSFDLSLGDSDVEIEEGLDTAVQMSLFSNGRVDNQEGYWGDFLADIVDDKLGSTLWSVIKKKNIQATRLEAVASMEAALGWLIDDSIARNVQVEISNTMVNQVEFTVKIENFRDERPTAFSFLWDVHSTRILEGVDA